MVLSQLAATVLPRGVGASVSTRRTFFIKGKMPGTNLAARTSPLGVGGTGAVGSGWARVIPCHLGNCPRRGNRKMFHHL